MENIKKKRFFVVLVVELVLLPICVFFCYQRKLDCIDADIKKIEINN